MEKNFTKDMESTTKKTWVAPSLELISKDTVKGGTLTSYAESTTVSTFFHGGGS